MLGVIGMVLVCQQRTGELTFSIPKLTATVQHQMSIQDGLMQNLQAEIAKPGAYSENAVDLARQVKTNARFWRTVQWAIFLAFTIGFAVKVPLFPLHTWLPLAHVESADRRQCAFGGRPAQARFVWFPSALCAARARRIAIDWRASHRRARMHRHCLRIALRQFAQHDVKKMVAYSSVAHMGFCVLGLFALNATGITGSLMQMINHGLSTGALFLLVGLLYERYHTRMMNDYGGMAAKLKMLAIAMIFICLSSVGMPFLNGFVGEMMVLAGVVDLNSTRGIWFGAIAAAGIVLGAWYLFTMLQKVFFGPFREPHHDPNDGPVRDLNLREIATVLPVMAACLFIGVFPQSLLDATKRDIAVVARIANDARARAEQSRKLTPEIEKILTHQSESR